MRFALLVALLIACSATTGLATPSRTPRPLLLLAGPRGTLLVVTDTAIEERDTVTGRAQVSVPVGTGTPVAIMRSASRVYVLFALEQSHRLLELDENLNTVAGVTAAGAMSHHYPTIEPGKNGVRVAYVHPCPEDAGGCIVYETRRVADLSLLAVRTARYHAVIRTMIPGPPIPRDQGDSDLAPGVPPPVLDGPHFGVLTSDGPVDCDPAVVGKTVFVLSRVCCGDAVDCKLP